MPDSTKLGLKSVLPLIVDDNNQALEVLASILMGFGVNHTQRAHNVEEATIAARRQSFDFILVDYEMPVEDGLVLVRRIRDDPGNVNFTTPIIMVSSATPRDRVEEARDIGVDFMIAKPVIPGVLLDRIRWVARASRSFVNVNAYRGPDRRFHTVPLQDGVSERRAQDLALTSVPTKALSQNEIDELFS